MIGFIERTFLKMKKNFSFLLFLLLIVVLVLSTVQVKAPLAMSKSGYLQIYASEIILAIMVPIFSVFVLLRKKYLLEYDKVTLKIIAFLMLWVSIISVIRANRGDNALQVWLAVRTTVAPVVLYYIYARKSSYAKIGIISLAVFCFIINCIQLASWNNIRMSDFMGNSFVYVSIITMLILINIYSFSTNLLNSKKASILLHFISCANIIMSLVFIFLSGSRILIFLIVCSVLWAFVLYRNIPHMVLRLSIIFSASFVVIGLVWIYNPLDAARGMYRIIPSHKNSASVLTLSTDIGLLPQPSIDRALLGKKDKLTETAPLSKSNTVLDNVALREKDKSDAIRFYLWEESIKSFANDPLIGDGNIYHSVETDYGVEKQAAHNFILEHWNAYGFLGLLIYLTILYRILLSYSKILKRKWNLEVAIMLTVVAVALASSMFQPTMLIMPFVVVLYVAIGSLHGLTRQEGGFI